MKQVAGRWPAKELAKKSLIDRCPGPAVMRGLAFGRMEMDGRGWVAVDDGLDWSRRTTWCARRRAGPGGRRLLLLWTVVGHGRGVGCFVVESRSRRVGE